MLKTNNTREMDFNSDVQGGAKTTTTSAKKMYSLSLPGEVLEEIKRVADKEDATILQVIRNFIKFGLAFYRMKEQDPTTKLIIRQGDSEQVIFWF